MKPKIHGHRGARGRRPENTLAAVEYALQHADGVEVDLCVTEDDIIVLHHDLRLNPDTTRDGDGNRVTERVAVRALSFDALRQYDVGRLRAGDYAAQFPEQTPVDGARIPSWDEFVALTRRHDGVTLNLELKSDPRRPEWSPNAADYAELVTDKLAALRQPPPVLVQSFDWNLMASLTSEIKKRNLNIKTGFTKPLPFTAADINTVADNGGDVFSCNHRGLTAPMVKHAHDLGLEVCAWTVNDEQDTKKLTDWGVDIITTDYPDRCR